MTLLRKLLGSASLLASALILCATVDAQSPPPGFTYETLVDGPLQSATAMAFLPDGRLLITERESGNIRLFANGQLDPTPWATVAVHNGGPWAEAGLLGIAVDPLFSTNGYVYVFFTAPGGSENQIARLQDVNEQGTGFTVMTPAGSIPAQLYHNAGTMIFGHDGTLFVGTGDALGAAHAQNPTDWRGKILRFAMPNFTVPGNNPTPGSMVYSLGHRNQFGLAIHPVTGDVYQTENGGAWMDEINHILPGGNYGWPIFEGLETTPNPGLMDPLAYYQPTSAPTGCCFYTGEHYPAIYKNAWFFTNYNSNELRAVWLDASGSTVLNQTVFDQLPGSGYAVTTGPDGNLWYLTNDTGGYGADELGRYVHTSEVSPSLQTMSVSNKTIGASVTVCVHAQNGSVAVPWFSQTMFPTPQWTPFGNQWVPVDTLVYPFAINTDNRGYMELTVPNLSTLLGLSFFGQAMVLDAQQQLTLTNPSEQTVRG
ncbi:MAG: glucose/arabinose dehydrogenase [Planctomycetota bacterium]|jgi:glucose/arabinose dehydrogenase